MSEKSLLFYFSSSSHLNYLLLPCNPFQLDSMETKRLRNYSRLTMLALTFLFCMVKAKGTRASRGMRAWQLHHLLMLELSEEHSARCGVTNSLLSRAIKISSITHTLIDCKRAVARYYNNSHVLLIASGVHWILFSHMHILDLCACAFLFGIW